MSGQRQRQIGGVSLGVLIAACLITFAPDLLAQLSQSGGGGSNASVSTYPATAPASATLTGGQFNTSPPTLTNGQMGAVQLDASGNVKVAPQGPQPVSGSVSITGTPAVTISGTPSVSAAQSGAWSVSQTGTWTMQPGNRANTTPWFVKQIPFHGCTGNTLQDVTQVDVATTTGSALTSADTCVFYIYANNKTGSAVTLTLQDKQGTAVVYSTTFSIPANSDVRRDFAGHKFLGGVQAIAGTSSAINAVLMGVQ
jgi:hypothetical protein